MTERIVPSFSPGLLKPPATVNLAKWMHERIVRSINDFEKDLDSDQEIGARLVSFGSDVTFHIEDVSFWGPDMIIFEGFSSDGKKVRLLQHVSQLSVLLVATSKLHEKARRIGFDLAERLNENADVQE
ncbi:MAG: hypothetical protein HQ469_09355 [Cyanobacteria bacterium]|nr:hypothetical protein [Cyanobacteria bacterium bin.275]